MIGTRTIKEQGQFACWSFGDSAARDRPAKTPNRMEHGALLQADSFAEGPQASTRADRTQSKLPAGWSGVIAQTIQPDGDRWLPRTLPTRCTPPHVAD